MPKKYVKRNLRNTWPKELLDAAMNAIKEKKLSVNAASKEFKIPRRTLRGYLSKGPTVTQLGRNTVLSPAMEKLLCDQLMKLVSVGYPLTSRAIRSNVFTFCSENKLKHNFNEVEKLAGQDWLKSFLRRHPEITELKNLAQSTSKESRLNRTVDYFHKLEDLLTEINIVENPQSIYNMVEVGFRSRFREESHVSEKEYKSSPQIDQEEDDSASVIICGNALGCTIPPMILFKGNDMEPESIDGLPQGSIAMSTPKGSLTCDVFVQWLGHLAKYKSQGNCLLIFDRFKCQLDYRIVEVSQKHQIILFCLPSLSTNAQHPLVRTVFDSFKTSWDQEVVFFTFQNPKKELKKDTFGSVFCNVWDKAINPFNIKADFRRTGIFPFRPDIALSLNHAMQMELPEELVHPENSSIGFDDILDSKLSDNLQTTQTNTVDSSKLAGNRSSLESAESYAFQMLFANSS